MKKNLSIKWLVVKDGIEKFLIKNFEIYVPSSAGNFKEIGFHTQIGINKIFPILSKLITTLKKKNRNCFCRKIFKKKRIKKKY